MKGIPSLSVVVVGGGAIGCAAALSLARGGAEVRLLEREELGGGASSVAAGMLAPLSESDRPGPLVGALLESLSTLRRWLPEMALASGVQLVESAKGTFMLARGEEGAEGLRQRATWQRAWDDSIELLGEEDLRRLLPHLAPGFSAALSYPKEGQIDAALFTRAVGRAAQREGVLVQEGCPVLAVAADGEGVVLESAQGRIKADLALFATGHEAELTRAVGLELPLVPVKGEMVSLRPQLPLFGGNLFLPGGYLTPTADGSVLVGATQKEGRHDRSAEMGSVLDLLRLAEGAIPELRAAAFAGVRVGLRPALPDHLPALGPVPALPQVWVAQGHHRNGILMAAWTAERLASAMLGGEAAIPPELLASRFAA